MTAASIARAALLLLAIYSLSAMAQDTDQPALERVEGLVDRLDSDID
jgi:hypothetical protein